MKIYNKFKDTEKLLQVKAEACKHYSIIIAFVIKLLCQ